MVIKLDDMRDFRLNELNSDKHLHFKAMME